VGIIGAAADMSGENRRADPMLWGGEAEHRMQKCRGGIPTDTAPRYGSQPGSHGRGRNRKGAAVKQTHRASNPRQTGKTSRFHGLRAGETYRFW